jgi:uncharacterized protein (TIGR03067 family)
MNATTSKPPFSPRLASVLRTTSILAALAGLVAWAVLGWGLRIPDAPAAPAPVPKADQAARDLKAMQGSWVLTEWNLGTKTAKSWRPPAMRLTVKGRRFILRGSRLTVKGRALRESGRLSWPYDITLNAGVTPKAINFKVVGPSGGDVLFGVYSLRGDVLRICLGKDGKKPRPGSVTAAGRGGDSRTFKRVKKR